MKLTYGPNVDDETVLRCFEDPSVFPFDLIDEFFFHQSQVLPSFNRLIEPRRGGPLVPSPVHYAALLERDAFRHLEAMGKTLAVEVPAMKGWDPYGDRCREQMHDLIDAIRAGGFTGRIVLALDEPYTWAVAGKYTTGFSGHTIESCADVTANFIREAHGRGVSIRLIEAWSNHELSEIRAFVKALAVRGHRPDDISLDIDAWSWGKPSFWTQLFRRPWGLYQSAVTKELQGFVEYPPTLGCTIVLTEIMTKHATTEDEIVAGHLKMGTYLRQAVPNLPRLEVRFWGLPAGVDPILHDKAERWAPRTLPYGAALLTDIARMYS